MSELANGDTRPRPAAGKGYLSQYEVKQMLISLDYKVSRVGALQRGRCNGAQSTTSARLCERVHVGVCRPAVRRCQQVFRLS